MRTAARALRRVRPGAPARFLRLQPNPNPKLRPNPNLGPSLKLGLGRPPHHASAAGAARRFCAGDDKPAEEAATPAEAAEEGVLNVEIPTEFEAVPAPDEPLGSGAVGAETDTYAWLKGDWVQQRPWPVQQEELDSIPTRIHAIAHQILSLDQVDHNRLLQYVAFHTGAQLSVGGGGGGGGAAAGAEEEAAEEEAQTEFNVVLKGFDAKAKIKLIKEVRTLLDLGLKEAKSTVEGAPAIVGRGLPKEAAEELKEKLEGLGAEIDIE